MAQSGVMAKIGNSVYIVDEGNNTSQNNFNVGSSPTCPITEENVISDVLEQTECSVSLTSKINLSGHFGRDEHLRTWRNRKTLILHSSTD